MFCRKLYLLLEFSISFSLVLGNEGNITFKVFFVSYKCISMILSDFLWVKLFSLNLEGVKKMKFCKSD